MSPLDIPRGHPGIGGIGRMGGGRSGDRDGFGVIRPGDWDTASALEGGGLVARFSPIKKVTPKIVLDHAIYCPAIISTPTVTEAALHTDYDTLSSGQFSQPSLGPPHVESQLRTLPIDTLTLDYDPKWFVVTGQHPDYVRRKLADILRARRPVHLLVFWHPHKGQPPDTQMPVTVRTFTHEVRPGENDANYMTLDIHEWRDPSTPVDSSRPPGGSSSRKHGEDLPTTTKLAADDTLHSLSHEFYGSFSHWREIRDANKIPKRFGQKTPIVNLGGHFKVGAKIIIPKPDQSSGTGGNGSKKGGGGG